MADFALELSAPVICEVLSLPISNLQKGKTPYLGEYINSIQKHFASTLNVDYISNRVLALHDNRGRIQHSGVSFDRDSSYRMYSDAKEYIDLIFSETFGRKADEINVSLSVSDESVRKYVDSAITKRQEKDLAGAASDLAIAYAKSEDFLLAQATDITGITWEQSQIMRSGLVSTGIYETLRDRGFRPEIDHSIKNAIERIANILQLQQLGLENSEIALIINRMPLAERAPGSEKYFLIGERKNYTDREIDQLIQLIVKVIWRMQNLNSAKS